MFPDTWQSKVAMENFVRNLRDAAFCGAELALRNSDPFINSLLAPGYHAKQWLNDPSVDRESRRFLLSQVAKRSEGSSSSSAGSTGDWECLLPDGRSGIGVGQACIEDGLAVSLPRDDDWREPYLIVQLSNLGPQGELEEDSYRVRHIGNAEHVQVHCACIADSRTSITGDGREIWKTRVDRFPKLDFCESVEAQLRALTASGPMTRQVIRKLRELQVYCANWTSGWFEPEQLASKATPEYPRTLDEYGDSRMIRCPDGEYRQFSWHIRLTPGAWRLYFIPLPESKRMIIGYVGKKPPSADYPT